MLLESLGLSPSNFYIYIEFDLDLFRFPPGVNLELNFLSSNSVMLIFHLILDRQARGMTKFGKASPQLLERQLRHKLSRTPSHHFSNKHNNSYRLLSSHSLFFEIDSNSLVVRPSSTASIASRSIPFRTSTSIQTLHPKSLATMQLSLESTLPVALTSAPALGHVGIHIGN
jgi:hypothetical protein